MTGSETFRTVAGRANASFEINGSEFIGYVSPADTVAEAEAFIEQITEKHPEATHNVPAYRVPAGEPASGRPGDRSVLLREWASDDGEPAGSAGKPALNVLVQEDVRNVVVVVTRYHGGPNLGVGGLARSYARGVKVAIEAAGIVERVPHERVQATVDYDDSGTVRGILESSGVEFDAEYDARVRFDLRVPIDQSGALRERLRDATSGRVELQ
ncbi:MAG: IMPACT family protein [Halobacteriota archaeon]